MKKPLIFLVAIFAAVNMSACGDKGKGNTTPVIVNPDDDDDPSQPVDKAVLGQTITPWTKGYLDIHFVNNLTGECTFIIMPDGTQMLVDAAGSDMITGNVSSSASNAGIRQRWDPNKETGFDSGKFIMEYLDKCMAWTGNHKVDYVLNTHLHNDHYGSHLGHAQSSLSSTYQRQSLVDILDNYEVGKLMDRGYPDYNYPFDMMKYYTASSESSVYNWITAVKWHVANKGLKAEKFVAGRNDQISLQYAPEEYPGCKVQNLSVNGDVWTGVGTGYTATFPAKPTVANPPSITIKTDNAPEENHNSCAFKLSYGKFDYFGGGDLQYDGFASYHEWLDIETPVAKACGKVEVMKADHHGSSTTNGWGKYESKYGYEKAYAMYYLQPQCWVVCGWTDIHPRQETFEGVTGLLPGVNVFINNTCTSMHQWKNYDKFVKGYDGHILVRVSPGGSEYYVYTLSDKDRKLTVTQISGPFKSR